MRPHADDQSAPGGVRPRAPRRKRGSQTVMLVIALLLFAGAVAVFLWTQGYLGDSGARAVVPTEEQRHELQIQEERSRNLQKQGVTVGG